MAISATSLGAMGDTGAAQVYGVALTRAPAANTLVLVDIVNTDTGGTVTIPSSVSGAGLVFSLVTSTLSFNPFTAGSQGAILSTWRSMGASPDGSRITCAGMGSGNNLGCAMFVTEYSGVSTSGTSGANAVGQDANDSATAALTFDQDTGPTSAASTANGWHNAVAAAANAANGTPDRFAYLGGAAYATPSTAIMSAWTTSSSATTLQWTFGTSGQHVSNFIELVADNPAGGGGGGGVIDTWYYRQARQGAYFA